jgi:hypothetical protein
MFAPYTHITATFRNSREGCRYLFNNTELHGELTERHREIKAKQLISILFITNLLPVITPFSPLFWRGAGG